jgi:ParB/RepB/Spo0J family partition protein
MAQMSLGFIPNPLTVPLELILPSRKIPEGLFSSRKFKQIQASIDAVGLIEPLSVRKPDKNSEQYILLDGHIRLLALRKLGFTDTPCLVATDDESYTYNNRLNRLSTIQEHFMIRRAVERGVTPERLAEALQVNVSHITKKLNLLEGVCAEAAELLSDQQFSADIGTILRKMKPTRQVECVELMLSANNITLAYAKALLVATPPAMLINGHKSTKLIGVTPEQMAKMEHEMTNLQGQYKLVEQTYGQDVLNLVLAKSYLTKLLENKLVARYLDQRQPEILSEFKAIIQTVSLEG